MNTKLSRIVDIEEYNKLDTGEKFIVDWQYGTLSHFKEALKEVMCRADNDNLMILALSFPAEARAILKYRLTPGWWEALDEKVRRKT